MWIEPQPVIDVNATLTADNAVQIKCKSQQVYGPERVFELTWENGGKEYFNNSYCDFKRENLLYLTNYTFTVSRLLKLNVCNIAVFSFFKHITLDFRKKGKYGGRGVDV